MRVALLAALALLIAVVTGGGDPFARLALRLEMPGIAERLTQDPVLRGLALSGMGEHVAAAAAFASAGPSQTYNRATAHAMSGDYAEALLTYDDLLVRDPDHADARANFSLLVSIYSGTKLQLTFADLLTEEKDGPTVEAPEGQGGARAIGDGAQADGNATDIFAPKVDTSGGIRVVPKIFDDVFIAATEDWLTTMLDQPGTFLAARLLAEQKRRRAAGSGVSGEEGAW